MPNVGNVWLRGREKVLLAGRNGDDPSGVKKGDVLGLADPAEKGPDAASVNRLERAGLLWEWKGR